MDEFSEPHLRNGNHATTTVRFLGVHPGIDCQNFVTFMKGLRFLFNFCLIVKINYGNMLYTVVSAQHAVVWAKFN